MSRPSATPFARVLIANRGEVALRVMRTARWLGLGTVAVYSAADAKAMHVRAADAAVCIGGALPSQSYLDIASIIAAARETGAEAVHPGYGFLAERADFAEACRAAGLVFVGPSADSIRTMGDKALAKRRMSEAGVPCIPGHTGAQDDAELVAAANRLGFPLMIKAVAGGGGRGMRRVVGADEFLAALHGARSEAWDAFGNADVMLEPAIVEPRHVEVQVVADRYGAVIHLGERDCSVQRRHQKLIEEAPAPGVRDDTRAAMGAAAIAAARAIGYEGVGTLEFLLDAEGQCHFMEMNTRLQVEHAVTEAITGLDIVELQLRIAAGEPLALNQDDVRFDGHAIEARLCAEDPGAAFMPQSGRLRVWHPGDAVRVDHALESGDVIPPFYDSMIAKLIAHGRDREDARRRLALGLEQTVALGVTTNRGFLLRCLEQREFARGGVTTAFVERHTGELMPRELRSDGSVLAIAAWLAQATRARGVRSTSPRPSRLTPRFSSPLRLDAGGRVHLVSVQHDASDSGHVVVENARIPVALLEFGADRAACLIDGERETVYWSRSGNDLCFTFRGHDHRFVDRTLEPVTVASAASDGRIRASTDGRVVAIHAAIGDRLAAGQAIFTLEAMKMEHTHTAPVAGTLCSLDVEVGAQVSAARVVARIEPQQVNA